MGGRVKQRAYVSDVRSQAAAGTRARILAAARDLFLDMGYAGTTTTAVARAAGVSQAAVFAAFGSKPALLVSVVASEAKGVADVPMRELPDWRRMAAEPDPVAAVALFASFVRRAHERTWRLLGLVRSASDGDPALGEAAARAGEGRRDDCAWFMTEVLRLPRRVARGDLLDVVWAQASVDMYRLLVVERGWPPARYERWLAETLRGLLLDTAPARPPSR